MEKLQVRYYKSAFLESSPRGLAALLRSPLSSCPKLRKQTAAPGLLPFVWLHAPVGNPQCKRRCPPALRHDTDPASGAGKPPLTLPCMYTPASRQTKGLLSTEQPEDLHTDPRPQGATGTGSTDRDARYRCALPRTGYKHQVRPTAWAPRYSDPAPVLVQYPQQVRGNRRPKGESAQLS